MKFTILGRMPTLNELIAADRTNKHIGNRMKQDEQQRVCLFILKDKVQKTRFENPVYIHYRFYEKDRRRDKSNVAAFAIKVIEDAIQEMHIIKNDNWKGIDGYSVSFDIDKINPRIEVEIYENQT